MSAHDMRLRFTARTGDGLRIKWRELRYRGPLPHKGNTIRITDADGEIDLEVTGVRINAGTLVGTSVDDDPPADFAVANVVFITCRRL